MSTDNASNDATCVSAPHPQEPTPSRSAELHERVILVTGAGSGIGAAVAQHVAAAGATVILLDQRVKPLEKVYDQIEAAGGPQPAIYPLNLLGATPKDYVELATRLKESFGRLDGLLHNAAVQEGLTPIANFEIERWYHSLQVNLNGPFLMTQALLGLMASSSDAAIVFTTDSAADEGNAYWGAYAVAKGGLQVLTKMLANELKANTPIRVNAIDPGPVATPFRQRIYPGINPNTWPAPATIMAAYSYLLGPRSRGVTGQLIRAQAFCNNASDRADDPKAASPR